MKKTLILAAIIFLTGTTAVQAYDFTPVNDNQIIQYSPALKTWRDGMAPAEDNITFMKKTSAGTGSYSIYYNSVNTNADQIGSNFEFITLDGRLIACNNAALKFFELTVENGKLVEKKLSDEQIKEIFPNVEIIKISQFKDKKYTIGRKPFEKKEFLLLNDTDEYFHKYSFKPRYIKKTPIAGLFELERYEQITFSHYQDDNERFPAYTINVRFELF